MSDLRTQTPRDATGGELPPALALLELGSIARGMVVADAVVKRAEVILERAEAVTPGKFLVLFRGLEEEVSQSYTEGRELSGPALLDQLYLPNAEPALARGLGGTLGKELSHPDDALAVVETFSVAATLLSADRALKAAEVTLLQMRLASGLGGKAFYVLGGPQHQLEAALEAGSSVMHDGMLLATELIPRPHQDFVAALLR